MAVPDLGLAYSKRQAGELFRVGVLANGKCLSSTAQAGGTRTRKRLRQPFRNIG
jgi:hypothetical protein